VLALTMLIAIMPSLAQSSWYYKDWLYRRMITIDNTANSNTLADYIAILTIDTSSIISQGKMNSDCSDLRFTYYNETSGEETEIPYWIEYGCNTPNTNIWVKVPYIPPKGSSTIFVYYGNTTPVQSESQFLLKITNINSALTTYGSWFGNNVPIFQKPENKLTYLFGYSGSSPISYYWNGANWVNDNSFVNGISGHFAYHGLFLVPYEIFKQLGAFETGWWGAFYNNYLYWNGNQWVADNSKLPQNLPECYDFGGGGYNSYVFVKDSQGRPILIRISRCGGHDRDETQFYWDGSKWVQGNYVASLSQVLTGDYPHTIQNFYFWLGDYSNPSIYHYGYNLIVSIDTNSGKLNFYHYDETKNSWEVYQSDYVIPNVGGGNGNFNLLNESSSIFRLVKSQQSRGDQVYFLETNFYRTLPEPTAIVGAEETPQSPPTGYFVWGNMTNILFVIIAIALLYFVFRKK